MAEGPVRSKPTSSTQLDKLALGCCSFHGISAGASTALARRGACGHPAGSVIDMEKGHLVWPWDHGQFQKEWRVVELERFLLQPGKMDGVVKG